jgi:hypothetical protein
MNGAEHIAALRNLHKQHVDLRNSINHAGCGGRLKSDPEKVVFAPVKNSQGDAGCMLIEIYHISQFIAATAFAQKNGDQLNVLIDHFQNQRSPLP